MTIMETVTILKFNPWKHLIDRLTFICTQMRCEDEAIGATDGIIESPLRDVQYMAQISAIESVMPLFSIYCILSNTN